MKTRVLLLAGLLSGSTSLATAQTVDPFFGPITTPVINPGAPIVGPEAFSATEFNAQYGLDRINAATAFNGGFFGNGVPIAVFDTAVDLVHPEFGGRISGSFDMFTGLPVAAPDGVHGTHVAGIAAAGSDGTGMMGVAPGANLFPVVLLRTAPGAPSGAVTGGELNTLAPAAFDFALSSGVTAINHSWGNRTPITVPGFQGVFEAVFPNFLTSVRKTAQAGVVNVWATGNDFQTEPGFFSALPFLYPELTSTWLAVTALDPDGSKANYANACGVAANWCIAAPGTAIISSVPGGGYAILSGTSMATPHVTGALAVAKEVFPNATGPQLRDLVLQTATDIGQPGIDSVFGWGLLNLGNIVNAADPQAGALHAVSAWSRFATMEQMQAAIPNTRISSTGATSNGLAALAYASIGAAGGLSEGGGLADRGVWIAGIYGQSHLDGGGTLTGAKTHIGGVAVGADFMATDALRLGAAAGYSSSDLTSDLAGDSGRMEGLHLFGYLDWQSDGWFVSGIGQLAFLDQSITRSNIAGSVGGALPLVGRGQTDATAGTIDLRVGHDWTVDELTVSPYLNATGRWQSAGAFNEMGAGIFSLAVQGTSLSQFAFGPGVGLQSPGFEFGGHVLQADLDLSYAFLTGDRDHVTSVNLLGSTLQSRTVEVGVHVFRIGTGLNLTSADGRTTGFIAYDGRFQDNTASHGISGGVRVTF